MLEHAHRESLVLWTVWFLLCKQVLAVQDPAQNKNHMSNLRKREYRMHATCKIVFVCLHPRHARGDRACWAAFASHVLLHDDQLCCIMLHFHKLGTEVFLRMC